MCQPYIESATILSDEMKAFGGLQNLTSAMKLRPEK